MSLELQRQYKAMDSYSIVRHRRKLKNEQVRTESFKVSELIFGSKMEKGTSPMQLALKKYEYMRG